MPTAIESLDSIIQQAARLKELLEDAAGDEFEEDLHEIDMNLSGLLDMVKEVLNG